MNSSNIKISSLLDLALVVVAEFLGGGGLSVAVVEYCCFGRRSLDVLPNLDCKCWSMDSFVA